MKKIIKCQIIVQYRHFVLPRAIFTNDETEDFSSFIICLNFYSIQYNVIWQIEIESFSPSSFSVFSFIPSTLSHPILGLQSSALSEFEHERAFHLAKKLISCSYFPWQQWRNWFWLSSPLRPSLSHPTWNVGGRARGYMLNSEQIFFHNFISSSCGLLFCTESSLVHRPFQFQNPNAILMFKFTHGISDERCKCHVLSFSELSPVKYIILSHRHTLPTTSRNFILSNSQLYIILLHRRKLIESNNISRHHHMRLKTATFRHRDIRKMVDCRHIIMQTTTTKCLSIQRTCKCKTLHKWASCRRPIMMINSSITRIM